MDIDSLKPREIKSLLSAISERAYTLLASEIDNCAGVKNECRDCPSELFEKCVAYWDTKCCNGIIVSSLAHNLRILKGFKQEYSEVKK